MAQLIGYFRIGKNAEVRYLQDGKAVSNLSLAYNFGQKGQDGKKPTQWVEAALWGQRAESLSEYLVQGQGVCATVDDVHIETYTKGDGSLGTKLTGQVSHIEFAGAAPQPQQGNYGNNQQQAPRQQPQQHQQPQGQRQAPPQRQQTAPRQDPQRQHAPRGNSGGFEDMDSDIPFANPLRGARHLVM
jgi:single-strand DNA-binding protein